MAIGEDSYNLCYQCMRCSSGCPVAWHMDILPHKIVKLTQVGLTDAIVNSQAIWLCVSCHTCSERCPNEIPVSKLIDFYREESAKRKAKGAMAKFHRTFVGNIRRFGRVHELSLMALLKIRTLNLFQDISIGLKLIRRSKLPLLPDKTELFEDRSHTHFS